MAQEWYYLLDGEQRGPVSGGELKQLAAAGKLRPNDKVKKEGMPGWVAASQVKGLFPPTAAETGPMNRRDHRNRQIFEAIENLVGLFQNLEVSFFGIELFDLLDIGAGAAASGLSANRAVVVKAQRHADDVVTAFRQKPGHNR